LLQPNQVFGRDHASQNGSREQLFDLMPDFFRAYDAGTKLTEIPARVQIIGKDFLLRHADIYTAAGFNGGVNGRFYDERLAQWLMQFDLVQPTVRKLSRTVLSEWNHSADRFKIEFQDFEMNGSIVFLVSLLSFDGQSMEVNGRPMLFFGLDTIARQQLDFPQYMPVLFSHELFHLYHESVNFDVGNGTLWSRIWREGLATCASRVLNPRASLADVLISHDLPLIQRTKLCTAVADLLPHLDEVGSEAEHLFFDGSARTDHPRLGYLIGFRVAETARAATSLSTLAKLDVVKSRRLVEQTLLQLCCIDRKAD
jgi:hypothetical protein